MYFKNSRNGFFSRKLLVTVALSVMLTGCSSVPDAINPVEWYKSARDAISGDDEKKKKDPEKSSDKSVPGENEPFPKLSSVPPKPTATVAEERKRIAEGLVADREEARKYSGDVIRRQGDSANPLPAPPPPAVNLQPAPAPQPKAPVVIRAAPPKPKPVVKAMPKVAPKPAPKPEPVTSLRSQTQSSVSPKLRVAPPSAMLKIPNVNPNSPQLAAIPGVGSDFNQSATVVVSGSGVQTFGGRAQARQVRSRAPAGNVNVAGVRSLGDFDPNGLQGSYQVATIMFDNGSSQVKSRARRVLRQVLAQHKQVGGTLRVVGHASSRTKTNDPIRHKMANFEVSTARAERVANALVKMGVKANKLFVGSVSDSEPRYYEYMPSGEAGNRRTEIYIDF